jgi:hypothetical protein
VVVANLHNAVAVGVVGMRTSTYALPTSMMGQRYAQESVGGLQTWNRGRQNGPWPATSAAPATSRPMSCLASRAAAQLWLFFCTCCSIEVVFWNLIH